MREEIYIVSDGIRIGFFNSIEEAQAAIKFCNSGFIMTQRQWEERFNGGSR